MSPNLERYLVWDGDPGSKATVDFSVYKGAKIFELLKVFKGVMVNNDLRQHKK